MKTLIIYDSFFSNTQKVVEAIADELVRAGGELIGEPTGFFVADKEGPLKPGELKRAAKVTNYYEY